MNGSWMGAPFRAIGNFIQVGNGNFVRQDMFDEKWKVVERIDATLHDKDGLRDMVVRIDERVNGKQRNGKT